MKGDRVKHRIKIEDDLNPFEEWEEINPDDQLRPMDSSDPKDYIKYD